MVQKAQFPNESALAPGLIDELLGGWTLWPFRRDLAAPRMGTDVQDRTEGVPVNAPHEGVLGTHPVMGERGREGRGEKKREGERSEGRERKGKREGATKRRGGKREETVTPRRVGRHLVI